MKQFLRLFAVVGVVLLTALISAGSCDKDGDGNKNTNNNGIGMGPLKITPVAAIAKVKDSTIYLKASAFPATAAGTATENFSDYNAEAAATRAKAFDIEVDKATGGMVVVANGNIIGATDVTTPGATGVGSTLPTTDVLNKDVHVHINAGAPVGTLNPGANIFSVFADKTAATTANVDAKTAPFAFSAAGGTDDTQPILWCVSTITGATASAATTKLTGGQKSSCYVASVGAKAIGGTANAAVATAWFAKAAPFKREIAVGIAGIRTDGTTLDKIGLTAPAGTPAAAVDGAIVGEFQNGITKAEMKAIVETAAKNGLSTHVGFKAYNIKVVNDADFTAAK